MFTCRIFAGFRFSSIGNRFRHIRTVYKWLFVPRPDSSSHLSVGISIGALGADRRTIRNRAKESTSLESACPFNVSPAGLVLASHGRVMTISCAQKNPPYESTRRSFSIRITVVLLLFRVALLNAQSRVFDKKTQAAEIRCTIEVDSREWKRDRPTAITGTIENLFDGPLDIAATPTLYLSAFSPEDRYWAPVDVLKDRPLSLDKRPVGLTSEGVMIRPLALHLTFKKKGDSIHFRIDAQHILWARTISALWPSMHIFAVVEPGTYEVRLVLESQRGESESNRVKVVVSNEPKQATAPLK